MRITCFIVDDSVAGRDRIYSIIENFFSDDLEVIGMAASPSVALVQILHLSPEIIFLDVEMPGITGIDLAQQLNDKGYKGKIIFVTGHLQYSVKALRANAFDYLVKPIDVQELEQAIERFKNQNRGAFNRGMLQNFEISKREEELMGLMSMGLSSEEMAIKTQLSRHTIDTHRRNIHHKTGTRNVVELINLFRE